jgi:aminomethyltransferase
VSRRGTTENLEPLERTPFYDAHVASGARMAPFGGWDMPVQYAGILDEARAVRSRAGMFDVSHMGRVDITGSGAAAFLGRVLSSGVSGLKVGRARYGVICNLEGGIIDDAIVYRLADDRFLLIPNAANADAVVEWISRWLRSDDRASIRVVTAELAMIALQGPQAAAILPGLTPHDLSRLRPFRAVETVVMGAQALVARTGYTGEDGFEIVLTPGNAVRLWEMLLEKGATPCGLGARDVLRLEAGLALHGNDIDLSTNPYEAGLARFVDPDRADYVAGEALRRIRDEGNERSFVGFNMVGRGIARQGHPIMDGSERIGTVTSGGVSPTLDINIGMGYVPTGFSDPPTRFQIDVRGRLVDAEVTALPFYSRRRNA